MAGVEDNFINTRLAEGKVFDCPFHGIETQAFCFRANQPDLEERWIKPIHPEHERYPECEKVRRIQNKTQICGEFLDWLREHEKIVLATTHHHSDECKGEENDFKPECDLYDGELIPIYLSVENLVARFFGIDLDKVESEKQAILAEIRAKDERERCNP